MRRLIVSLATVAVLSGPAVAWAAPADRDAWVKQVEKRLERVLKEPTAPAPAGTRVGEVRMQVGADGALSGFEMIRSTGSEPDDALILDAAEDMGPVPAPPASAQGKPLVVRVTIVTPDRTSSRPPEPKLQPYVYIEETPLTVQPQQP